MYSTNYTWQYKEGVKIPCCRYIINHGILFVINLGKQYVNFWQSKTYASDQTDYGVLVYVVQKHVNIMLRNTISD